MVVWSVLIETDKKVMSLPAQYPGLYSAALGGDFDSAKERIYLYSWRGVRGPRPVSAECRYDLLLDSARGVCPVHFCRGGDMDYGSKKEGERERERERERECVCVISWFRV